MLNDLNIITWNARGIKNKSLEFFQFLLTYNIHICLVTESWLKPNIALCHQEFNVYRNDRVSRRGGGVAIIIRKNISHLTIPIMNTSLIENVGIKVFTGIGSVNIYSCYFAGGRVGTENTRKRMFTSDIHKLTRGERYIIGGDLNSRHQSWGCLRANCWGNTLHEKQVSYNFNIIYPNESTHIPSQLNRQSSTLDLFITNIQNLSSAEVINELSSDHLPVKVTLKSQYDERELRYFDFKNANWQLFSRYISRHLILPLENVISSCELVDSALKHLISTINDAILHSVPQKVRNNCSKQLPRNIKSLIRRRNLHRRKWLRHRDIYDYHEFKTLNRLIKWETEKFKNKAWNQLLSTLDKGSSPFWNLTKIIRKKSKNIPILKHNNSRFSTTAEKCEILAQNFHDIHAYSTNLGNPPTDILVRDTINEFNSSSCSSNNVSITYSNISAIMKRLKSRKSPGVDGINNSCLKALPRKGIQFLTIFVNSCLNLSYFPDKFKEAKIIAIKKPNKPCDSPSSYRPISLLSSISKILERVIKEKLLDFLDENNILPPQQFGFRREHNTIHPLVRIQQFVKSNFSQQRSTGMVLLDIKAAFDYVWHDGLIYKLIRFNFPPYIIKIIQSFLSTRTFRVHIGSVSSEVFHINAGCPQGSCLSPILYNIYTADIPNLNNCIMSIFADDTAVLCAGILSSEILSNLQLALAKLIEYFTKWKISINCDKSQAIYFTRKRKECFIPQSNINVSNSEIKWEKTVKYLGVVLDMKLTYKDHISYIVNKSNILIRSLYPFINRNSALNIDNKMLILKLIFHAVLFYAAPVWAKSANCHLKRLQILQNKLLKLIHNLPRYYSTARLHQIANVQLVAVKIDKLSENFNARCSYSEYNHIIELAS